MQGLEWWCLDPGSNQGHADFQSAALPTELSRHIKLCNVSFNFSLQNFASQIEVLTNFISLILTA